MVVPGDDDFLGGLPGAVLIWGIRRGPEGMPPGLFVQVTEVGSAISIRLEEACRRMKTSEISMPISLPHMTNIQDEAGHDHPA